MTVRDEIVVVGASGFGRETLDVLEAMQKSGSSLEVLGVIDDAPSKINLERLKDRGAQYLGTIEEWLSTEPHDINYVLAIGNPKVRRLIVNRLERDGLEPFSAIHPSVVIGQESFIGAGSVLCAGAVISTNVRLGRHVHVNPSAAIGHDAMLDDFVSVNPAAVISGEVTIHKEVLVGAGALILQQLEVGQRTTVGAAALVTRNVPADAVVKGIPGRWD